VYNRVVVCTRAVNVTHPPSHSQVEETLSTLSYATRTKNIHNRPIVQYDPREAQISLLRREIELLRQENSLLKEQLRAGTGAGVLKKALNLSFTVCPTNPLHSHMQPCLAPVARTAQVGYMSASWSGCMICAVACLPDIRAIIKPVSTGHQATGVSQEQ
jgi:hypothetical protein